MPTKTDLLMAELIAQGYTTGTIQDRQMAFLRNYPGAPSNKNFISFNDLQKFFGKPVKDYLDLSQWPTATAPTLAAKYTGAFVNLGINLTANITVAPLAGDLVVATGAFRRAGHDSVSCTKAGGGTFATQVLESGTNQAQLDTYISTDTTTTGIVTLALSASGWGQLEVYVIRGLANYNIASSYKEGDSASPGLITDPINAQLGQFVLGLLATEKSAGLTRVGKAPAAGWTEDALVVGSNDVINWGRSYRIPAAGLESHKVGIQTTVASATSSAAVLVIG